ncbi:MAG: AsmA family protein [Alphaproteobacteria bacterium]|nr:AsmA family protein [Alphaproteobacteria bacterium]
MIKKIFFILVLVVALAFGGLSVYVSTIDWNLHKSKIAEQFEEISGKKIVFEGPVSLSFLPSPYLSAKDIKIYNNSGESSDKPLAVIDEMVTDLALVPLIKGNFVIENMTLLDAKILIAFLSDGKINWYSKISDFQKDKLDTVDVALNSVLLKNASVEILNDGLGLDITLQNLNAEVTAESLFGPYRIDGNFIKDGNPAGFALNLGTLSESFATSLNLVLTHPTTESYARFDGSMLSSNKEIKGNFIVESKKPSDFINSLTNQVILPAEFNYPLASSIELITNERQIDLSSFIIKYGDNTAGAGNVLIPLKPNPNEEKRKIEAFFEMTDLDLMPIIGIIKEQLKKLDADNAEYAPYYDFDLITDIKAVKATFNNQPVRNFNFSADLINDVFTIKALSGLFSGDTDINVNGDIFENEKMLSYRFNVNMLSQDFLKFLDHIKLKPDTYAQSTYRNASANFVMEGNLKQVKIAPIDFKMDKTSIEGLIGIARDKRNNVFISLKADSINFDNYIPHLNEDEKKLPFNERLKLVLNKFKFLNNFDFNVNTSLDLGVYNGIAFEKSALKFTTDEENIKIEKFNIENINNSVLSLSGNVDNIADMPHFKNIKYNFKTAKFKDFVEKFSLPLPKVKLIADAQNINAKGIFSGNINNINIKAITTLDKLSSVYAGQIFNADGMVNYRGNIEFRYPDFVDFVNRIGYKYNPQQMAANIFTFKADLKGNNNNWSVNNVDAFIGSNNFAGDFSVTINDFPKIMANLHANKFEFNRFIYNPENLNIKQVKKSKTIDTSLNFLKRPTYENVKIDYGFYKTFELDGKFSADNFSINGHNFENTKADISIKQGLIDIKNISATQDNAKYNADIAIDINATPSIKAKFDIKDADISDFGGKKYEFTDGLLNATVEFIAPVTSEENFVKGLNGSAFVEIADSAFKGWDLDAIEKDVKSRTHSDGLYEMLRTNLQSGETNFYNIKADFDIKNGNISIKNAHMDSNRAIVTAKGSADLTDWNVNLDFALTYNQLKEKIVPIEYKWTDSLNNPNLVINSSALKDKYDTYWEKVRLEQEAAEKARIEDLNNRMNSAQDMVEKLKNNLEKEMLPNIKKYAKISSNVASKNKFDSSLKIAEDMLSELLKMQNLAKQEFADEQITQINAKTEVFESELNNMKREIEAHHITDIKNLANENYALVKNTYDNSLNKGLNYQDTLNAYVKRLIDINSLVILDNEPKVADYKNKIETSLRDIADLHNKALNNKNEIELKEDISHMELQFDLLKETSAKIETEMQTLNQAMQDLFDYAKDIVRKEEDENIKKQEALKAAQKEKEESQENEQEDENLLKDNDKQDSKIIILEEGEISQILPKSAPIQDASKPLLILKDNTEQPAKRSKFTVADSTDEEVNAADAPNVILEKPTANTKSDSNTVSYRPKIAPSGTIVKPKSANRKNKKPTVTDDNVSSGLLKPLTGEDISSGGTITKQK